jgi:LAO/AO transport system kinase
MDDKTESLLKRLAQGDQRALSRLITYVDNDHPDCLEALASLDHSQSMSKLIGITGPPGAGKSTLTDQLISSFRHQKLNVGVIAIDPSSPFTGGAVLGDRIRMQRHAADDGVFIRSLGSHGSHGGLSNATRDVVALMKAFGLEKSSPFDVIIVETVGVGQTELDIMSLVDTTVVVLVPESGDTVQTMKAGLMEIADIFVVNKSDRTGADHIFGELKVLSHIAATEDWEIPVHKVVASQGKGLEDLLNSLEIHQKTLEKTSSENSEKKNQVLRQQVLSILTHQIEKRVLEKGFEITEGENPYAVVKRLLSEMNK